MLLLLLLLLLALASLLSFPALQLSSDNWWRLLNTQTGDGCHSEREVDKTRSTRESSFLISQFSNNSRWGTLFDKVSTFSSNYILIPKLFLHFL